MSAEDRARELAEQATRQREAAENQSVQYKQNSKILLDGQAEFWEALRGRFTTATVPLNQTLAADPRLDQLKVTHTPPGRSADVKIQVSFGAYALVATCHHTQGRPLPLSAVIFTAYRPGEQLNPSLQGYWRKSLEWTNQGGVLALSETPGFAGPPVDLTVLIDEALERLMDSGNQQH